MEKPSGLGWRRSSSHSLGRSDEENELGMATPRQSIVMDEPMPSSILEVFCAQAKATPDSEVVIDVQHNRHWMYADLVRKCDEIYVALVARGVVKGDRVGICLSSCRDIAICCILAIWKAGAAVVPFNAELPAGMKAHMVVSSELKCLLVDTACFDCDQLPPGYDRANCLQVDLDSELADRFEQHEGVELGPRDIAVVFFTSGSTGRPKGVLLPHGAIVNRFMWMWREYPFEESDVCLIRTSVSFVDMLWEAFGPLCKNVRCVVATSGARRDVSRLLRTITVHNVTRMVSVPGLLSSFVTLSGNKPGKLSSLRLVISSGEALSTSVLNAFSTLCPDCILLNLYGSTEVAGDVVAMEYACSDAPFRSVHIGRVLTNNNVYILNNAMQRIEEGSVGELCVTGANLADGYTDKEATALKFISNPFVDEDGYSTMFVTGDLVRMESCGLAFVGRKDRQVKVNGHRIELDGIEQILLQHPDVTAAAAVVFDDNYVRNIVAYVVGTCSREDLQSFARENFPEVSIPVVCVKDKIPLLANGKVDRMHLEQSTDWLLEDKYKPPRTMLQIKVAAIMEGVLNCLVGMTTNFFNCGGDSLTAVRLLVRLNNYFAIKLTFIDLAENPTLADLSAVIKTLKDGETDTTDPATGYVEHFEGTLTDFCTVEPAVPAHAGVVSGILVKEFVARDALSCALAFVHGTQRITVEFSGFLADFVPMTLEQGLSRVAVDAGGEVIGVCLAADMSTGNSSDPPPTCHTGPPTPTSPGGTPDPADGTLMRPIFELLHKMEYGYHQKVECAPGRVLSIAMTAVNEMAKGYQVAYAMEKEVLRLAKERGYERVVTICTHAVTHDMARLLKYQPVLSEDYYTFTDTRGRKPFMSVRDLHQRATLYERIL